MLCRTRAKRKIKMSTSSALPLPMRFYLTRPRRQSTTLTWLQTTPARLNPVSLDPSSPKISHPTVKATRTAIISRASIVAGRAPSSTTTSSKPELIQTTLTSATMILTSSGVSKPSRILIKRVLRRLQLIKAIQSLPTFWLDSP